MLAQGSRMRRSHDFIRTVRAGSRAGRPNLVVHLLLPAADAGGPAVAEATAGFVVSRAVGGAVQRNRVKRRLRHLVRPRLADLPAGSTLVVRALPGCAVASGSDLARDLDGALATAGRRATGPSRSRS